MIEKREKRWASTGCGAGGFGWSTTTGSRAASAPTPWTSSLAAFALALVGGGVFYLLGWIGAGDTKLFAAAALFAGLAHLPLLFVGTALAGGLYAVAVLVIRPKEVMRGMTARGRTDGKLRGIPYGVAIAAGALLMGYMTDFLGPLSRI